MHNDWESYEDTMIEGAFDHATYDFYLNLSEQDVILSGLSGMDLVTGETINGNVTIPGRGNLVVKTV